MRGEVKSGGRVFYGNLKAPYRQTPDTLSWIFQVHQQMLNQSGMGNWGDMRILLLLTCALSINNGSYAHKRILCRSVTKPVKDMDAIHPQDVHILCRSVSKPSHSL